MDDLKGLTGGRKAMWYRLHRDEILEYLDNYGKEATMKRYHMRRKDVFERFVKHDIPVHLRQKFTRLDRIEMKVNVALAGSQEVKGRVTRLEAAYQQFVESVGEQLAMKFFLPLVRLAIKLDPSLELKPDDRLNLNDLFREDRQQLESSQKYGWNDDGTIFFVNDGRGEPYPLSVAAYEALIELLSSGDDLMANMDSLFRRVEVARYEAEVARDFTRFNQLNSSCHSYLAYVDFYGNPSISEDDACDFLNKAAEWYAGATAAIGDVGLR